MSTFDVLIQGAKVVDGTGNPWFYGDVALAGDSVAAVTPAGQIDPGQAVEAVDAAGQVVCPGFIDILSHSILPLMIDGRSLSKITQGVTTEIMGEGWTPAPFGGQIDDLPKHPFLTPIPDWAAQMKGWTSLRQWLEAMIEHGVSPNIGAFLGGGTLREYGKGMALGPATAAELAVMRQVMREAMAAGAFGISHALIYPPSAFIAIDELVDICRVVGEFGGLYITHIRSEADGLIEGIQEAIEIGRRANVPVEIYHLKAAGKRNWPKMAQVIDIINEARAEGIDVTADMYPYPAAGTGLSSILPPWAEADGRFYDNLRDPQMRAKIRAEALNPSGDWEALADLCGPDGVMPVGFQRPENRPYAGQRLAEIAARRGQEWIDAAFDLFLSEEQAIDTIYFMMDEENLKRQLQLPWLTIGTDAGGLDPAWAKPIGPYHPRAYGSYPRILGKYVRDEQVLPLEDAIRKMSGAVAQRLGLLDRGLLRPGFLADVVIFDPATIGDRATFEEPHQLSVGIREVWVNGTRVLQAGRHTGAKPGRIVEGPGQRE
ncbi:MAG: D-aminoacylase [Anaerolineales bacterium]|nr:D-aminoacylase [Anaerolineales bacterium]